MKENKNKILIPKFSLIRYLHKLVNHLLNFFNLSLVRKSSVPNWEHFFKLARFHKYYPKTIFDIGVAYGTPSLYKEYPNSFYYLIDPLKESVPFMEEWSKTIRSKIFNIALGSNLETNYIEIEVRQNLGGTTFLEQNGCSDTPVINTYMVPMQRLDSLIQNFDTPALCKIDVQGLELEVLNGMSKIIENIDVFIIECHTIDTLKNMPIFTDLLNFLQKYDFVVYDVLSLGYRPLDSALAEIDIVFVKSNSVFRKDNRWK
jgi:FkbM family methyltransferase